MILCVNPGIGLSFDFAMRRFFGGGGLVDAEAELSVIATGSGESDRMRLPATRTVDPEAAGMFFACALLNTSTSPCAQCC